MQCVLDIKYGDQTERDPLREFDIYYAASSEPLSVIVFVHGGAWRSEDKADYSALARKFALEGYAVLVPNYRLTPKESPQTFRHPRHARDILDCLLFFLSWQAPPVCLDTAKLYLIGHSCSAHMLASIFLDSSTLSPPQNLLQSVQAIIMSEGIYDIDLLLEHFPTYRNWFIEPAFGPHESFAEFSTTRLSLRHTAIRWLIIHSKGDTLVDMAQSKAMYRHLCELYANEGANHVAFNTDLDGEHNDILHGDTYVQIITRFIPTP